MHLSVWQFFPSLKESKPLDIDVMISFSLLNYLYYPKSKDDLVTPLC
jgi:hypothetical protein